MIGRFQSSRLHPRYTKLPESEKVRNVRNLKLEMSELLNFENVFQKSILRRIPSNLYRWREDRLIWIPPIMMPICAIVPKFDETRVSLLVIMSV